MSEMNDAAMSARRYAAVIIAYHRPDLLTAVLDRLGSQTLVPDLVIVVDNGGDIDESLVTGHDLRPVLVRRGDNPGYGAAVNTAVATAREAEIENMLVLTHDAVFGPTLAEALMSALAGDPGAGCVAPTLRWVSKPERVFSSGGVLTRGGRAYHRVDEAHAARAVHWVDGAIALYRVAALDEIGGMDEGYFLYFEDVDTGWALACAGWRTLVVPESAQQEPGAHPLRLGIRNMVLFARKARLSAPLATLAVLRRAGEELVVAIRRDRRFPIVSVLRGITDGLIGRRGKP